MNDALAALSALAQESRLKVFQTLIQCGPDGMPAGEIAHRLDMPHNTLSTQLAILSRASLVASERDGRSIIYRANMDGLRNLLRYLVQDCCGGHPKLCGNLLEGLMPLTDCPQPEPDTQTQETSP